MMRPGFARLAVVACACAIGCRSPASHYYTLIAPSAATAASGDEMAIDVLPVDVPPEVDRTQIVVRQGAGAVDPVDTRSWIAPLPLEIRRAIADDLTRALGARDISGLSLPATTPAVRIKVSIQRFESALGSAAEIDAVWSVRAAGGSGDPLTCSTRAVEPATATGANGDPYDAIAVAHQRALARIADQIAAAVRAGAASCGPTATAVTR